MKLSACFIAIFAGLFASPAMAETSSQIAVVRAVGFATFPASDRIIPSTIWVDAALDARLKCQDLGGDSVQWIFNEYGMPANEQHNCFVDGSFWTCMVAADAACMKTTH